MAATLIFSSFETTCASSLTKRSMKNWCFEQMPEQFIITFSCLSWIALSPSNQEKRVNQLIEPQCWHLSTMPSANGLTRRQRWETNTKTQTSVSKMTSQASSELSPELTLWIGSLCSTMMKTDWRWWASHSETRSNAPEKKRLKTLTNWIWWFSKTLWVRNLGARRLKERWDLTKLGSLPIRCSLFWMRCQIQQKCKTN